MSESTHDQSTEPARSATRRHALRAAAAGAALLGGGAWIGAQSTEGRPSRSQDMRIFNFLLVLEEAQAAFYDAALHNSHLSGELLHFVRVVAPQEHEHVSFLRQQLGSQARAKPKLDFTEATSDAGRFRATAIELEEAAAAAYIGQGASLTRSAVVDAARIVAVEARHAAWIRDLAGTDPAPRAADPGRSADDVLADLRRKGFLQ